MAAQEPVVRQVAPGTRAALPGGRARLVFHLRYVAGGRDSFILQTPAGRRIPLMRGTRVGTRLLRTTFWAPVIQDGRAGADVTFTAVVRGVPPRGRVLRVILRHPDGALDGVDLPV